jgi:hypothetical protein
MTDGMKASSLPQCSDTSMVVCGKSTRQKRTRDSPWLSQPEPEICRQRAFSDLARECPGRWVAEPAECRQYVADKPWVGTER